VVDYLGIARVVLLFASVLAFVFIARNLKGILVPSLAFIGAGFGIFLLEFILRSFFGSSFLYSSTSAVVARIVEYIAQVVGVVLLLYGFYRANRVMIDSSERQRLAEEQRMMSTALAHSEKRYREFFEQDLSGNFIATPGGTILACNPAFARIFGYSSAEEMIDMNSSVLYESRRAFENVIELIQQHRRLSAYQMTMRRKDEGRIYVVANMNGEFDEAGELIKIQGFVLDETERIKVEETLRNSVEQFRQVFEKGPVGMMLVTLDGDIIKVNNAFCSMVGHTETELRKVTIDGITHHDDVGKDVERQAMLAAGEIASYRTEKRFFTKQGDVIWGLVTVSVVREFNGAALYGVRIIEDITARKRGEEELEKSLSVLRSTLEATTDAILVVDENRRVLNYNQRFVGMWNVPRELLVELNEDSIVDYILEQLENQDRFKETVGTAYAQPEVENYDILRLLDGRVVELSSRPQKISGKTRGRVWSFRDVTVRVHSEEERRASDERYRDLFEESKDVVFISTPDGRFLDINSAGVELFGYESKEELLSVDIARELYVDPAERERASQLLAERGYLKDHLTRARRKDGKPLVVLETTTAERDRRGKVLMYRGILRDITEQHRLEEQLRQAQRLESVGTLAGGVAHDFNNILSIALGYLTRLDRPDDHPDVRARTVESIRKALGRGAGLVQQLLTFARKTSGVAEAVEVNEVVRELSTLLAETFPATIRFELDLAADVPLLLADQGQFQQALMNLCINSRDAMMQPGEGGETGGTLKIMTATVSGNELRQRFPGASEEPYILVRVADNGVGMDEATKRRIFEPFFTTKPPGKGTGIGLSVVYGIVDSHHGFIDVDSRPGMGTTVSLYFPILPVPTPVAAGKEIPGPERGAGETVLLVEDEEMLLDLLQVFLEENGYKVLTARDGMEAVEVYQQNVARISVVLSDMGLPKLGGWEAFRRMKQINPSVRCILASGYFDPDLRSDMIREGALDFVQKPYIPNAILSYITAAIRDTSKSPLTK
jgi:PAS domain S-box-containing protein